jgi:hypothetical protein
MSNNQNNKLIIINMKINYNMKINELNIFNSFFFNFIYKFNHETYHNNNFVFGEKIKVIFILINKKNKANLIK